MRIVSIRHTNTDHRIARERAARRVGPVDSAEKPPKDARKPVQSTALVATERDGAGESASDRRAFVRYRPDAAFLTHLIAARDNVPQLSARRRAEPELAIESYSRTEASARRLLPGRVIAVAY